MQVVKGYTFSDWKQVKEEEIAAALEAKRDITQVNEGQLRTAWMTFPAMVARTGTITCNDRFQQLLGELLHMGEVLLGFSQLWLSWPPSR